METRCDRFAVYSYITSFRSCLSYHRCRTYIITIYGDVYAAFDTTNGKYYVGQETGGEFSRKKAHLKTKGKNYDHFHNALQLRPDDFDWTIVGQVNRLETNKTSQAELNDMEVYFGTLLHALAPEGYSYVLGGANGLCSEELKGMLSIAVRKMWEDPEARKKMSEIMKKRFEDPKEHVKSSIAAKKHWSDPEARKRISRGLFKRYSDPDARAKLSRSHGGRPFRCIENSTVYNTISDASKHLGFPRGNIHAVLQGRRKHVRGFHFMYTY